MEILERWNPSISHPVLSFSDSNRRVSCNISNLEILPISLSVSNSTLCCFTIKIRKIPTSGSFSFGMAYGSFPINGSVEFGEIHNSWGIRNYVRGNLAFSIIEDSGIWVSRYRSLIHGDELRLEVNFSQGIAALIINDELSHKFGITVANPREYVLGCSLSSGVSVSILYDDRVVFFNERTPSPIAQAYVQGRNRESCKLTNYFRSRNNSTKSNKLHNKKRRRGLVERLISQIDENKDENELDESARLTLPEIEEIIRNILEHQKVLNSYFSPQSNYSFKPGVPGRTSFNHGLNNMPAHKFMFSQSQRPRPLSAGATTKGQHSAPLLNPALDVNADHSLTRTQSDGKIGAGAARVRRPRSAGMVRGGIERVVGRVNIDGPSGATATGKQDRRLGWGEGEGDIRYEGEGGGGSGSEGDGQVKGGESAVNLPTPDEAASIIDGLVTRMQSKEADLVSGHKANGVEDVIQDIYNKLLEAQQSLQVYQLQRRNNRTSPKRRLNPTLGSDAVTSYRKAQEEEEAVRAQQIYMSKSKRALKQKQERSVQRFVERIRRAQEEAQVSEKGRGLRASVSPQDKTRGIRPSSANSGHYMKPLQRPARVEDDLVSYDMRSGRRIPSGAIQSAKRLPSTSVLMSQSRGVSRPQSAGSTSRAAPVTPSWPSRNIEAAAAKWVKEHAPRVRDGDGEEVEDEGGVRLGDMRPPSDVLPEPVPWPKLYGQLLPGDLLLTVEHCVGCDSHQSFRHNEQRYMWEAENLLLDLVKAMQDPDVGYRPLARVGVARIPRKCPESALKVLRVTEEDPNPYRYGAFEVQAAYMHPTCGLMNATVHSKLQSAIWPTRTTLMKSLDSFMSKAKIPRHGLQDQLKFPVRCNVIAGDVPGRCPFGCREVRDEPYLPGVPLPANYEPFRIGSKISFVIMDDPPSHTSVDPRLAIVHNLRRLHYPDLWMDALAFDLMAKYGADKGKEKKSAIGGSVGQEQVPAPHPRRASGADRDGQAADGLLFDDMGELMAGMDGEEDKDLTGSEAGDGSVGEMGPRRRLALEPKVIMWCLDALDQALVMEYQPGDRLYLPLRKCSNLPQTLTESKVGVESTFVSATILGSHVNGKYTCQCTAISHGDVRVENDPVNLKNNTNSLSRSLTASCVWIEEGVEAESFLEGSMLPMEPVALLRKERTSGGPRSGLNGSRMDETVLNSMGISETDPFSNSVKDAEASEEVSGSGQGVVPSPTTAAPMGKMPSDLLSESRSTESVVEHAEYTAAVGVTMGALVDVRSRSNRAEFRRAEVIRVGFGGLIFDVRYTSRAGAETDSDQVSETMVIRERIRLVQPRDVDVFAQPIAEVVGGSTKGETRDHDMALSRYLPRQEDSTVASNKTDGDRLSGTVVDNSEIIAKSGTATAETGSVMVSEGGVVESVDEPTAAEVPAEKRDDGALECAEAVRNFLSLGIVSQGSQRGSFMSLSPRRGGTRRSVRLNPQGQGSSSSLLMPSASGRFETIPDAIPLSGTATVQRSPSQQGPSRNGVEGFPSDVNECNQATLVRTDWDKDAPPVFLQRSSSRRRGSSSFSSLPVAVTGTSSSSSPPDRRHDSDKTEAVSNNQMPPAFLQRSSSKRRGSSSFRSLPLPTIDDGDPDRATEVKQTHDLHEKKEYELLQLDVGAKDGGGVLESVIQMGSPSFLRKKGLTSPAAAILSDEADLLDSSGRSPSNSNPDNVVEEDRSDGGGGATVKRRAAARLASKLEEYMKQKGIPPTDPVFFSDKSHQAGPTDITNPRKRHPLLHSIWEVRKDSWTDDDYNNTDDEESVFVEDSPIT